MKNRIIAINPHSFSWSSTAGRVSLFPFGQKSTNGASLKLGLSRKTTKINSGILLLQMLTVGLLVFQHLLPDSLSLSPYLSGPANI